MYRLIIDGVESSATGTFNSLDDVLWWYEYAQNNGASSAALWCGESLVQFFVRGEK